MTVALVEGMTVAIGHVGDSRAYLLRGEQLEQLTDDHSLVAELVRRGGLSPEEAQVHPQRSRDHARARHRSRRRRRRVHDRGRGRRRLPPLLGRAHATWSTTRRSSRSCDRNRDDLDAGREGAGRGREPRRRRGQHHGRRLPVVGASRRRARGHGARCRRSTDEDAEPDEETPRVRGDATATPRRWSPRRPARSRASDAASQAPAEPAPTRGASRLVLIGVLVVARRGARSSSGGCRAEPSATASSRYLLAVGLLTGARLRQRLHRASVADLGGARSPTPRFFFGLYLVAHVVARLTVPHADPYLLPMAALLTAVGLTEIYRLGPSDAFKQGLWIVIGVAVFAATLFWLRRDYRVLERYKYLFGVDGDRACSSCRACPCIGETINGSRLWVHVGGLQFQPGELGEDLPDRLPRRLPAREARGARAGAAEGLGAAARDLGRRDARARRDERPRQRAPLLRDLHRDALHRDARLSFVAGGARPLPRRRVRRRRGDAARRRAGDELALALDGAPGLLPATTGQLALPPGLPELPARQVALLDRATAASAAPASARGRSPSRPGTQMIPDLNTDFIYSALAQELGLVGVAALLLVFMVFVAARASRSRSRASDGFSKLLAAGLTFGFAFQTFVIVGGITRVIPLTGITLPFVSYGGSIDRRELPPPRRPAARSPTARTASEALGVNKQLRTCRVVALVLLAALIVATTYWQTWASAASRPAGQRDPARRAVHDRPRQDPRRRTATVLATNRVEPQARPHALLRHYPQNGLASQVVGYSTQRRHARPGSSSRTNDYLTGANTDLTNTFTQTLDKLGGHDRARRQRRPHAAPRRPAARAQRARRALRRGRRARPEDGRGRTRWPRRRLQPEPDRAADAATRRSQKTRAPAATPSAARQPRDRRASTRRARRSRRSPPSAALDNGKFTPTSQLLRPGLLHRVRQEGLQLERARLTDRPRDVRAREARRGATSTRSTPSSATSGRRSARG